MLTTAVWLYLGLGFVFCFAGVLFFYRSAFEKEKRILPPALLIIGGVILIAIGTAKYLGLVS